jgi:hypothetical protein
MGLLKKARIFSRLFSLSQGKTREEALTNIKEAIEGWFRKGTLVLKQLIRSEHGGDFCRPFGFFSVARSNGPEWATTPRNMADDPIIPCFASKLLFKNFGMGRCGPEMPPPVPGRFPS